MLKTSAFRASCYNSLNKAIRDATVTHGLKPWVIFVTSNEMGMRSLSLTADVIRSAYKIDDKNMLSIECFDGDPFDYPGATWFSRSTAKTIASFLQSGFWSSGRDLVVSCPTGICLSPSIVLGLNRKHGNPLVLHSSKPPKYSNTIVNFLNSI